MKVNLPNQITIARIMLAGVFFVLLAQYQYDPEQRSAILLDICLFLYVAAGVSDIVDGYLARKWGEVTSFGRVADPFADKILSCGVYIFYAGPHFVAPESDPLVNVTAVAPWMVVSILARELLVTALRGASEAQGTKFAANWWGKIKMGWQTITAWYILIYLAHLPIDHPITRGLLLFGVYGTVIVTALSLWPYLARARGVLSAEADATDDR